MTIIKFYHLTKTPLDKAMPKLLEKVILNNSRAILYNGSEEQVDYYNKILWTYTTKFFLPHGCAKDGHIEDQPIYLTDKEENPNNSQYLVYYNDNTPKYLKDFKNCLYLFEGDNENYVQKAREIWANLKKDEEFELEYWKQDSKGNWSKS